jgi:hypothetical protein
MEFSRCAWGRLACIEDGTHQPEDHPAAQRALLHEQSMVSQNSTAWNVEVDVVLGESAIRTSGSRADVDGAAAYRSKSSGIP